MTFFYKTPVFKQYVKKTKTLLNRWHREEKKYFIYGAGIHSRELLKHIKPLPSCFLGFIDQSFTKQKKGFLGFNVYPVEKAVKLKAHGILISSYEFQDKMKSKILELKSNEIEIKTLYPPKAKKDSFCSIFDKPLIKAKLKSTKPKGRKIAVVDTFFSWPPIGGSSVDLASIMNFMSKNGFDIVFFLPVIEDDLYFPRGRIGNNEKLFFSVENLHFNLSTFNLDNFIEKMSRVVTDYDPEFVFLGDMYGFKPYLAERLRKYKIIWRSYAYDLVCPRCNLMDNKGRVCSASYLTDPGRCKQCIHEDPSINWDHPVFREMQMAKVFSKKYHNLLIRNIERAYRIIVYNKIIKKRVQAFFPSFRKIKVISSGIDSKNFSKKERKKNNYVTILFPGRIDDPAKGFEFFLKVFHRLLKEYPKIRLLITGKTDFGEEGIETAGWIPHDQMPDLYNKADLCVMPALWEEPFGIAALEAMATGVPVIANAVGGLKKIIQHKKTGFLIPPGDSDKFYNAIKQLVMNEGLRKEMGKRGKSRAKEYSWNKIMEKYKAVFS